MHDGQKWKENFYFFFSFFASIYRNSIFRNKYRNYDHTDPASAYFMLAYNCRVYAGNFPLIRLAPTCFSLLSTQLSPRGNESWKINYIVAVCAHRLLCFFIIKHQAEQQLSQSQSPLRYKEESIYRLPLYLLCIPLSTRVFEPSTRMSPLIVILKQYWSYVWMMFRIISNFK